MITTWRIGTDTPDYTAEDLGGIGAKTTGGRWNRKGTALVYTASSRALACLETIVHLSAGGLPLNRYLVRFEIPNVVWAKRQTLTDKTVPVGWDALPAGKVSLDIGDQWVSSGASCIFEVPSSIVSEELNILINPAHPDAAKIVAVKVRKWQYDARIKP
ncbi:MAG: RES family NAD+ phosphorylase [Azonexus sp.]|nr:RES family NAD+ phosphorylase [Azonexus sp.]